MVVQEGTTIPYDFTLSYAGGFLPMQIFLGTDCLYTFAVAVFFKTDHFKYTYIKMINKVH